MRFIDTSLNLYRKTLKHIHPVHVAIHWLMTHLMIPLLEALTGFRTMTDDPFWFRVELLTGRHEWETRKQISRLVGKGMTVLDVGAHVGYYTRLCSKLVGPEGRVISFEPHPRTFETLKHNIRHLDNVTPLQIAAAEADGVAKLYDYLMMSASGSLNYNEAMLALQKSQLSDSDVAPRIAHDFPSKAYTVHTQPIDTCLADLGIEQVDIVKMDIEGAELGALRGMKNVIANSPSLVLTMEYNPQALQSFGFEPRSALAEVLEMGFARLEAIETDGSLTDLRHDDAALAQLTAHLMEHMGVINLLLTR